MKVSAFFPGVEEREKALRRVRTIRNKAKENYEERGLETLSMAFGLAGWEQKKDKTWEPCAPVLLRQATVRLLGTAQDEFELSLVDEIEVNPTLLHLLKVDFDCALDQEKLLDRIDGVIDEPWELKEAFDWITEHTKRVPGFMVEPRLVLANFAYAKLPMVRDLENAFDELVAHDLIAAIAGDEEARESVRAAGPGPDAIPSQDQTPLADEFLVLDADSSQNWAINAVLAGESLIVRGPPGTGKSQTIANLISSLVARDKRVLFVAEKRAAIDAVLKRLHQQKLELVLDLHGGIGSRRAFAQAIGSALAASRAAVRVDHDAEQQTVEKRRDELNTYVSVLHEPRQPWAVSIYEIRAELLGIPEAARNEQRFRGAVLERLDAAAARQVQEELREYSRLGGFRIASRGSLWAGAQVFSQEEAQSAFGLVDEIRRHALPTAQQGSRRAAADTGLPDAPTLADWRECLDLWRDVETTLELFEPTVYEQDLEHVLAALAPAAAGGFARMKAALTSAEYKTARAEARVWTRTGKCGDAELHRKLEAALEQRRRWQEFGGSGQPQPVANRHALEAPYHELLQRLEQLETVIDKQQLAALPVDELTALLDGLAADRGTLVTLPELHRLETSLRAAGVGDLLAELNERQVSEDTAVESFRHTWLQSLLEQLALADRLVEGFQPEKHEKAVEDFRTGDRKHIETAAARIRRQCAEAATRARDEFDEQARIVQHQAGLKTRHMPVRDLVRNTADVLLALKPCWATSPLVVSQLLPPKTYFDVVIFDEASQVTPPDAVPSILRGRQLVIAGDEKQLPPTAFFVSETPEDAEEEQELTPSPLTAGTKGFESILDALGSLLRFRMLRWHYRSRDERLIAFSNAHIYDRQLTTFPGVGGDQILRVVQASHDPTADTNSPTPEVEVVVDLILEHAQERPHESLGVIAMGIKHANRVEECLRQRLHENPELEEELAEFFAEDREERSFVKNLERVQGDERDAIILSIGYGKNSRGDLPYRFGPLLTEGGERRLNVAVTRAKTRLTLVSSFTHRDMDPEKSSAEGVKLLRQYLQYVESDGANLGDEIIDKPALNPFEVDVRDTLARRGLKLTAQYGSSGYWIDYAVQHPTQPGRYVLAIECDGATYHSSESARDRDRLRQEQLERLGWRFHRIWSSEWFYNKDRCVEKVLAAYEQAVTDADREPEGTLARVSAAAGDDFVETSEQAEPANRMRSRPNVPRGYTIDSYTQDELVKLIRWIESDDVLRTKDELLSEVMRQFAFQKRGKRIVASIEAAIDKTRPGR